MSRKALVVYGGWDGHQPKEVGHFLAGMLRESGFAVDLHDTLDAFAPGDRLATYDLIVPHWTMGKISGDQAKAVSEAVKAGTGIAGIHGGMCDAFRDNTEWQFMTGGQFVAHPGNDGTKYSVKIADRMHPITSGIADFEVASEQYYMHVDPANRVLAYTPFPVADGPHLGNGTVMMPCIWTRAWGKGRVFYSSLGHQLNIVTSEPHLTILKRGFLWAAR